MSYVGVVMPLLPPGVKSCVQEASLVHLADRSAQQPLPVAALCTSSSATGKDVRQRHACRHS